MRNLIKNKDLAVISGIKDSYGVLLTRSNYDKKLQSMINKGITNRTYAPTTDTILSDLKDTLKALNDFKNKQQKFIK